MASRIVEFWRELKSPSAPVIHPRDKEVFANAENSFNLSFPPPAYIGAIDEAVCVVLYANGGYDPIVTPKEFQTIITPSSFLHFLHHPGRISPHRIAPYYGSVNFSHLIESGKVALANAVAYRSRKISKEPENAKLARRLPSLAVHRSWLRDEVIPDVKKGNRILVIKRGGLWGLKQSDCDERTIFGGGAPVSRHLPNRLIEIIDRI